jgi:Fur family transcriptional regulator, ferric uptake regulator
VENVDQLAGTRVRQQGQRYNGNRRQLVGVLAASDAPLTIAEILARGEDLAQSSVYRNLVLLEQLGVVERIVTNDERARFELAEDFTEHHHHLICSACGVVRDFTVPTRVERSVHHALAEIAERTGFTLQNHRLDLVGVCPACTQ